MTIFFSNTTKRSTAQNDASSNDTYVIDSNSKGLLLTGSSGGDTIVIKGLVTDYVYKANGKTITLTSINSDQVIQVQLKSGIADTFAFMDGDVLATYTAAMGKVKASINLTTATDTITLTTKNAELIGTVSPIASTTAIVRFGSSSNTVPSTTGTTFTLTPGFDSGISFTGGTGDDTFIGTNLTVNPFDTLAASDGTDTFNYSDATAAAFAFPNAVTLSGFENFVVSRMATGVNSGAVTIIDSTIATGLKTVSYTDGSLAANMTAAVVDFTFKTATNVTVAATGTGTFTTVAITDTSTSAGLAGSALTTATVTKASGAVTLTGNALATVNLNSTAGLTTVAAAATRTLNVNINGTVAIGGVTDATATALTITNNAINGAIALALGTFTAAKATTVNYVANAENASMTLTAALATTLNVSGTKLARMTLTGDTALTTVNVTGSAGLTTDLTTGAMAVTLLDTSGTIGVTTVKVNTGTAVTGGLGNEVITVGATTKAINLGGGTAIAAVAGVSNAIPAGNTLILTAGVTTLGSGGSINGGTGSADTLSMVAADAVTLSTAGVVQTVFKTAVTGFEVLTLAAAAGNITVDSKGFGTFSTVNVTGAAQTVTIQNLASGETINITGTNSGVATAGSTGSGLADILNVGLKNTQNAITAFGTITTPNIETINITMTDTALTPIGYRDTLTIVDTSLKTLTVTGTSGLALTFAGTALTLLDASGISKAGGFTYAAGALQSASTFKGSLLGTDTINAASALAAVTITETAGANTITGSSTIASTLNGGTGADSIVGGAGIDTISGGTGGDVIAGAAGADSITLGTGADIVRYNTIATSTNAAGLNVDMITDFLAGTDKINFARGALALNGVTTDGVGDAVAALLAIVADLTSVSSIGDVYTALATYSALTASAADGTATVAQVYTFTNGTAAGTYLVVNDATIGFQAATDVVINITGVSGAISVSDFTFTA